MQKLIECIKKSADNIDSWLMERIGLLLGDPYLSKARAKKSAGKIGYIYPDIKEECSHTLNIGGDDDGPNDN